MAIKKRSFRSKHKTIVRTYYMESGKRVITAQTIHPEAQIDQTEIGPMALLGGQWHAAERVDPKERGGCEYEVYKT